MSQQSHSIVLHTYSLLKVEFGSKLHSSRIVTVSKMLNQSLNFQKKLKSHPK